MDCRIVFYSARKTSLCERALKKSLSSIGAKLSGALFATSRETLGGLLIDAFQSCDLAFIIGGLDFTDSRNTADIIASAAAECQLDKINKLKNGRGSDGYLLQSGRQLMVLLPDEPEQIEQIMQGEISVYIKSEVRK